MPETKPEGTGAKPEIVSIEVQLSTCSYCGYKSHQMNSIMGQSGAKRSVCGDCFVKIFDKVLKAPTSEENK